MSAIFDLENRYMVAAAVVMMVLAFGGGIKYGDFRQEDHNQAQSIVLEESQPDAVNHEEEQDIQVYVIGAVASPGVYTLPIAARVREAVGMAQALPEADLESINLAQKMEDGDAIVVPRQGEVPAAAPGAAVAPGIISDPGQSSKVNINTCSVQELDQRLPGVGPTLAQRIVDHRTFRGRFTRIEELKEVSGIGDKRFAELQDLITVR
ncbi:MAG: helix-hairpin-helix domain-containing protein [Syntrophomonas sp.]|nr:helix-hairpin-helix domain-containing protein [Syntrophomonas sp.]